MKFNLWLYSLVLLFAQHIFGQVSVVLNLVDDDGTVTAAKFTYADHIDPADQVHLHLKSKIDGFCKSFPNAPANCMDSTYSEYMRLYRSIQPWQSEETILSTFSQELILDYCSSTEGSRFSSMEDCFQQTGAAIRSVKLYNSFIRIHDLRTGINQNTLIPMAADWEKGIEGHTFLFADKVRIMQELADDPRVERVCEIGFNLGHSAINWITANPRASVLAFDVTRQAYTAAAINAISSQFPHRTVSLITGDSTLSVPNFVRSTNNGVKCNVLFVDGAHDFETAFADMVNFRAMANSSYHRVFIDDISSPGVHRAVDEAVAQRILYVHSVASVNQTLCMSAEHVRGGDFSGTYKFVRMSNEECTYSVESDYVQDQVVVGEFLF